MLEICSKLDQTNRINSMCSHLAN